MNNSGHEANLNPKELHQRAADLTREKILRAAMECFAKKGYQKTTTREIARKAGVTLGALYHHFKDKKDLLMRLHRSRQVESLEVLRAAMAEQEDFFEGLGVALRRQFQLLADDALVRGVTREYMSMAMTDPDVNEMHRKMDIEFRDLAETELKRQYPKLSRKKRALLFHMIFLSIEGLLAGLVVDSPVTGRAAEVLDTLMNTYRNELKRWI